MATAITVLSIALAVLAILFYDVCNRLVKSEKYRASESIMASAKQRHIEQLEAAIRRMEIQKEQETPFRNGI